jgi:hypothetical protein
MRGVRRKRVRRRELSSPRQPEVLFCRGRTDIISLDVQTDDLHSKFRSRANDSLRSASLWRTITAPSPSFLVGLLIPIVGLEHRIRRPVERMLQRVRRKIESAHGNAEAGASTLFLNTAKFSRCALELSTCALQFKPSITRTFHGFLPSQRTDSQKEPTLFFPAHNTAPQIAIAPMRRRSPIALSFSIAFAESWAFQLTILRAIVTTDCAKNRSGIRDIAGVKLGISLNP